MKDSFLLSAIKATALIAGLALMIFLALFLLNDIKAIALALVDMDRARQLGQIDIAAGSIDEYFLNDATALIGRMIAGIVACTWLIGLAWLWRAHRIKIDRPGVAARSLVEWSLWGAAALACGGGVVAWTVFSSNIAFRHDAVTLFFTLAAVGIALGYWLASLVGTPIRLRPAVPLATLLP